MSLYTLLAFSYHLSFLVYCKSPSWLRFLFNSFTLSVLPSSPSFVASFFNVNVSSGTPHSATLHNFYLHDIFPSPCLFSLYIPNVCLRILFHIVSRPCPPLHKIIFFSILLRNTHSFLNFFYALLSNPRFSTLYHFLHKQLHHVCSYLNTVLKFVICYRSLSPGLRVWFLLFFNFLYTTINFIYIIHYIRSNIIITTY